ncbi:MAG TPA: OmpA family protein [Nitrospiraceae bacterium]|nr:OmpA family protein [Nitrospiraceae bacterium]
MQKAPTASVTSGQVSPTIIGPDKDSKEIYLVGGLVLFLALVVAGFWYYSQSDEASPGNRSTETFNGAQVSQVIKHQGDPAVPAGTSPSAIQVEAVPVATRTSDILHDDIFFEISRKGLTDDGKAALIRHAEFLKSEPDWGVLLQGYTDQQGSMSYNRVLGLKRAETVKQHLMTLGVPERAIRTVSLGEEGALCIDTSDTCRRMNRRVHLELRKVGQEHMVLPAVITTGPTPVTDDTEPVIHPDSVPDEVSGDGNSLLESATSLSESDTTIEPDETTPPASPQ